MEKNICDAFVIVFLFSVMYGLNFVFKLLHM